MCIYRQKGSGEAEIREPTRGGSGRDQPHNQTNPAEQHPPRPPKKRGGSKKNAGRHKTCRVKGGIPKTTPTLYPQTAKPWRQSQPRRRPTGVGGFWNLGFVPLCFLFFPLTFDLTVETILCVPYKPPRKIQKRQVVHMRCVQASPHSLTKEAIETICEVSVYIICLRYRTGDHHPIHQPTTLYTSISTTLCTNMCMDSWSHIPVPSNPLS